MVNFKIVSKIIGQLLFLESMFMSWCLIMALCYREDDVMAFLMSIILAVGCGLIFMYFGRNASNNLSRRDASLTVTLVWIIFSFFGMMPFLIGGYINNVAGAYLETMSGFTTTGATVIDNVECLPHGILFWRSLTHWIGGLGIVFFTIAVLPSMVGGSVKIFAAEATGPIKSKMHPRLTTSAKWIWIVYLGLTLACVLSYYFTGMGWFDSFCYSMSTTATGGFGTHNTSISYFHSPPLEYAASLFQFLSGVNFVLLYTCVVKGKFKSMFVNSEFRLYVMDLTSGSLNPHDVIRLCGSEAAQQYLVDEVQRVYRSQGVEIADKHVEIIVRQMTKKVKVVESGDTKLLPGELVEVQLFENENKAAKEANPDAVEATCEHLLLGITKASLNTES